MLLAEELEVGLDQVRLEHARRTTRCANAILHIQTTAFVLGPRLLDAAAPGWRGRPNDAHRGCREALERRPRDVPHSAARYRTRQADVACYSELVDVAATLPLPKPDSVKLKDPKDFILIGTPAKRLDTSDKVNGRAQFGIDVKVPGMKIAAIAISPAFGGKPKSLNEAAARAVKGVRQVVRIDEAVAVVADHMWAAKKAKAAAIQWNDGPNATVSSADIISQLEEASKRPGAVARHEGDAEKALAGAAERIDAIYQVPFLAHAAMEPMNCTVHLRKDGCDLWLGTQAPTLTQAVVAEITGLPRDAIKVHNHLLGGGFGRRLETDGTVLAVKIAQQVNGPVKVVWSREEDIQHDMYRPYYYDRLSAGLDAAGSRSALDASGLRLVRDGALCPPAFPKWSRSRRGGRRGGTTIRLTQHPRRLCARRTARHPDRFLAWRRPDA
jgi:isoquinoline 1-oxidoreductase beta subunit